MKRRYYIAGLMAVGLVASIAWSERYRFLTPPILSVGFGDSYLDIVKHSTYAVRDHSTPPQEYLGFGGVWINAPAAQIKFNDPQHGFTLPPTRFAMVTLMHGKVDSVTTSPMLEALPFSQAVGLVNRLQADFKRGGWEPIERSGERLPSWFDTASVSGLAELRHGSTRELVVPQKKYSMYFNFKCWDDCIPAPNEKSRYLIDVSMGPDL